MALSLRALYREKFSPIVFFGAWVLICIFPTWAGAVDLRYEISMPKPYTHYFEVSIHVTGIKDKELNFSMPVWSTGHYLIQDHAKHVEFFVAKDGQGNKLASKKNNKNTWLVLAKGIPELTVSYRVFANRLTTSTSYLDDKHAYISGASVFMMVEGYRDQPVELTVHPYEHWKKVSTGLSPKPGSPLTYQAPDYDALIDCPLEVGNHKSYFFTAAGVEHEVVMVGKNNFDPGKALPDMARIVEECTAIFGSNPNKRYVFIVNNIDKRKGALEYRNSCHILEYRNAYDSKKGYLKFMEHIAHEYFHVWNVKRLLPQSFMPYDYNRECDTELLWFFEGFTNYFDRWIQYRVGLFDDKSYLKDLNITINKIEKKPGLKVKPLAESGIDAWMVQHYKYANKVNTDAGYYRKGAMVAMFLNLEIMHRSRGEKSLDDVMRKLYQSHYLDSPKGLSEKDIREAAEAVAGIPLSSFFERYLHTTAPLEYAGYLQYAGIISETVAEDGEILKFGARLKHDYSGLVVVELWRGFSAYEAGLQVGDLIVRMNDKDFSGREGVKSDWADDIVSELKEGDIVKVKIRRKGQTMYLDIPLVKNQYRKQRLKEATHPTEVQTLVRKRLGAAITR